MFSACIQGLRPYVPSIKVGADRLRHGVRLACDSTPYYSCVGVITRSLTRGRRGASGRHHDNDEDEDRGDGEGESSDGDIRHDIELALIQLKSETLNKVSEALGRLSEGTCGNCFECGDEIAEARLRAMPLAIRCKDCAEARETAEQQEQRMGRGSSPLFSDLLN